MHPKIKLTTLPFNDLEPVTEIQPSRHHAIHAPKWVPDMMHESVLRSYAPFNGSSNRSYRMGLKQKRDRLFRASFSNLAEQIKENTVDEFATRMVKLNPARPSSGKQRFTDKVFNYTVDDSKLIDRKAGLAPDISDFYSDLNTTNIDISRFGRRFVGSQHVHQDNSVIRYVRYWMRRKARRRDKRKRPGKNYKRAKFEIAGRKWFGPRRSSTRLNLGGKLQKKSSTLSVQPQVQQTQPLSTGTGRHIKRKKKNIIPQKDIEAGDNFEDVVEKKLEETYYGVLRGMYDPSANIDFLSNDDAEKAYLAELINKPLWSPLNPSDLQIARYRAQFFDTEYQSQFVRDEHHFGKSADNWIEGIDSPDLQGGNAQHDEDQELNWEDIIGDSWLIDLNPMDQATFNQYPQDVVGAENFFRDQWHRDSRDGGAETFEPSYRGAMKQPNPWNPHWVTEDSQEGVWAEVEKNDAQTFDYSPQDNEGYLYMTFGISPNILQNHWGEWDRIAQRKSSEYETDRANFLHDQLFKARNQTIKPKLGSLTEILKDPWGYPFYTTSWTPDEIRTRIRTNLNPQKKLLLDQLERQQDEFMALNNNYNVMYADDLNRRNVEFGNRNEYYDDGMKDYPLRQEAVLQQELVTHKWRTALKLTDELKLKLFSRPNALDAGGLIMQFATDNPHATMDSWTDQHVRDLFRYGDHDSGMVTDKDNQLLLTPYELSTGKKRIQFEGEFENRQTLTWYQLLSGDYEKKHEKEIWYGVDDADDPESVQTRRAIEELKQRLKQPEIDFYIDHRVDDLLSHGFGTLLVRDELDNNRVITIKEKAEADSLRLQHLRQDMFGNQLGLPEESIDVILKQREAIQGEKHVLAHQIKTIEDELDKLNSQRFYHDVELYVDPHFDQDIIDAKQSEFKRLLTSSDIATGDIKSLVQYIYPDQAASLDQLLNHLSPAPPPETTMYDNVLDWFGFKRELPPDPYNEKPKGPDMTKLPLEVDRPVPSIIIRKELIKKMYGKSEEQLTKDEAGRVELETQRMEQMDKLRIELAEKRRLLLLREKPITYSYTKTFIETQRDLPIRASDLARVKQEQLKQQQEDGLILDESDLERNKKQQYQRGGISVDTSQLSSPAGLTSKLQQYKLKLAEDAAMQQAAVETLLNNFYVDELQLGIVSPTNKNAETLKVILQQHRVVRQDIFNDLHQRAKTEHDKDEQFKLVKEWLAEFESRIGFNPKDWEKQQELIQFYGQLHKYGLYEDFLTEMIENPHIALKFLQNNFLTSGLIDLPLNRYRIPMLKEYDLVMRNMEQFEPIDAILSSPTRENEERQLYLDKVKLEQYKYQQELIAHEEYLLKLRSFRHEQLKADIEEDIELNEAPRREFLEWWRKEKEQLDKVKAFQEERLKRKRALEHEDKVAKQELDQRLKEIDARLVDYIDEQRGHIDKPPHPRWERGALTPSLSYQWPHTPENVADLEKYQDKPDAKHFTEMTQEEFDQYMSTGPAEKLSSTPWTERDPLYPLPELDHKPRKSLRQMLEKHDVRLKRNLGLLPHLTQYELEQTAKPEYRKPSTRINSPDQSRLAGQRRRGRKRRKRRIPEIFWADGLSYDAERALHYTDLFERYWGTAEEQRRHLKIERDKRKEAIEKGYERYLRETLPVEIRSRDLQAQHIEKQLSEFELITVKLLQQDEKLRQADDLLKQIQNRSKMAEQQLEYLSNLIIEAEPTQKLITIDNYYNDISAQDLDAIDEGRLGLERPIELDFIISPEDDSRLIHEAKLIVDREMNQIKTARRQANRLENDREREIDLIQYQGYLDTRRLAKEAISIQKSTEGNFVLSQQQRELLSKNPFYEDQGEVKQMKSDWGYADEELVDDFDVEQDRLVTRVLEYRNYMIELNKIKQDHPDLLADPTSRATIYIPPHVTDDQFIEDYILDDVELRTSPDPEALRRARRIRLREKRKQRHIQRLQSTSRAEQLSTVEQGLIQREIRDRLELTHRNLESLSKDQIIETVGNDDHLRKLAALLTETDARGTDGEAIYDEQGNQIDTSSLTSRFKSGLQEEKDRLKLIQRQRQRELDKLNGISTIDLMEDFNELKSGGMGNQQRKSIAQEEQKKKKDALDKELSDFDMVMYGGQDPGIDTIRTNVSRNRILVDMYLTDEEYEELKALSFLQRRLEQYQNKQLVQRQYLLGLITNPHSLEQQRKLSPFGDISKEEQQRLVKEFELENEQGAIIQTQDDVLGRVRRQRRMKPSTGILPTVSDLRYQTEQLIGLADAAMEKKDLLEAQKREELRKQGLLTGELSTTDSAFGTDELIAQAQRARELKEALPPWIQFVKDPSQALTDIIEGKPNIFKATADMKSFLEIPELIKLIDWNHLQSYVAKVADDILKQDQGRNLGTVSYGPNGERRLNILDERAFIDRVMIDLGMGGQRVSEAKLREKLSSMVTVMSESYYNQRNQYLEKVVEYNKQVQAHEAQLNQLMNAVADSALPVPPTLPPLPPPPVPPPQYTLTQPDGTVVELSREKAIELSKQSGFARTPSEIREQTLRRDTGSPTKSFYSIVNQQDDDGNPVPIDLDEEQFVTQLNAIIKTQGSTPFGQAVSEQDLRETYQELLTQEADLERQALVYHLEKKQERLARGDQAFAQFLTAIPFNEQPQWAYLTHDAKKQYYDQVTNSKKDEAADISAFKLAHQRNSDIRQTAHRPKSTITKLRPNEEILVTPTEFRIVNTALKLQPTADTQSDPRLEEILRLSNFGIDAHIRTHSDKYDPFPTLSQYKTQTHEEKIQQTIAANERNPILESQVIPINPSPPTPTATIKFKSNQDENTSVSTNGANNDTDLSSILSDYRKLQDSHQQEQSPPPQRQQQQQQRLLSAQKPQHLEESITSRIEDNEFQHVPSDEHTQQQLINNTPHYNFPNTPFDRQQYITSHIPVDDGFSPPTNKPQPPPSRQRFNKKRIDYTAHSGSDGDYAASDGDDSD